ncbi:MAG: RNA methyltransferase PUA domain-containing protein, partial [Bacteroidota bacterium]
MQVFYLTDIQEQQAFIGEEEARHFQVLRKQLGDVIHFMDGKGHSYQGEIIALNKRRGTIQILKKKQTLYLPNSHKNWNFSLF